MALPGARHVARLVSTSSEVLFHRMWPDIRICVRSEGAFLVAAALDHYRRPLTGVLHSGACSLQEGTEADLAADDFTKASISPKELA